MHSLCDETDFFSSSLQDTLNPTIGCFEIIPKAKFSSKKQRLFPQKCPSSDHTCPGYKAALKAQYTAATLLLLHHTLFFFCLALPHC